MSLQDQSDWNKVERVSVHGGHSGQFCQHASDSLEEVVEAYVRKGFSWAGITEHIPPLNDAMRYPDEKEAGLDADFLQQRFDDYFRLCREMQDKYAGKIELLTGFEIETYEGSTEYVRKLMDRYRPDYLLGSVHHVAGISIDVNEALFRQAVDAVGNIEKLYCAYFDAQYHMMQEFRPAVVAHFDLVRKFDRDYLSTIKRPEVAERIERNLALMAEQDLIMDFNLRGFDSGLEQYPTIPVLKRAIEMGISIVPGDDSHGVESVGRNYERGLAVLAGLGVGAEWKKPARIQYK